MSNIPANSNGVSRLLKKIGLRPQQAAGQNFLLSEDIIKRMVTKSGVTNKDTVLEIGPGLGILTEALAATGANVVSVELDKRLFKYLQQKFSNKKNVKLIESDVFRINLNKYFKDGEYTLVANLPYSGTSLFFRNFLSLPPRPSSMTVMIQREVAKRLTAHPGEMSVLSVMAQYYSQPEYLFDVPRVEFFPQPNVDSTVIQCQVKPWPDEKATKKFFRVVKAGFSSRRKQLHNSLAAGLNLTAAETEKLLRRSDVLGDTRAQDLGLENWMKISQNLG